MKTIPEAAAKIKNEYSSKQRIAREKADMRQKELHSKFPYVKELDERLAMTGVLIMEAIAGGKEGIEERIEKIKNENNDVIAKREAFLLANGYPKDYSDPKYECDNCCDSGYKMGRMCNCMREKYAIYALEFSGLSHLAKTQSFDSFRLDLYAPEHLGRAKDNLEQCKRYADEFSDATNENLLFVGTTGLGKTHLSTSIAKEVIKKGYYVCYVTAQSMISDFSSLRYGMGGEEDENSPTAKYYECDLLIIDDLGTELTTQFAVSVIYNVINTRISRSLPMIISTNLTSAELRKTYAERITSRLFGNFEPLLFEGKDNRMKLKYGYGQN